MNMAWLVVRKPNWLSKGNWRVGHGRQQYELYTRYQIIATAHTPIKHPDRFS